MTTTTAKRKRGAPPGNSNALKHGKYTRERRALYAAIRAHIGEGRALTAVADPRQIRGPDCHSMLTMALRPREPDIMFPFPEDIFAGPKDVDPGTPSNLDPLRTSP